MKNIPKPSQNSIPKHNRRYSVALDDPESLPLSTLHSNHQKQQGMLQLWKQNPTLLLYSNEQVSFMCIMFQLKPEIYSKTKTEEFKPRTPNQIPNKDHFLSNNMVNPFQKKSQKRVSFWDKSPTIQTNTKPFKQIQHRTNNPLRQTTNDLRLACDQMRQSTQKTDEQLNCPRNYTTISSPNLNPIKDEIQKKKKYYKGNKDQKQRCNTYISKNPSDLSSLSVNKSQLRKENDELNDQLCCRICMDEKRNCINLSCFHMVCCMQCALKVKKCPICSKKMVPQKVYL